ncbi:MAG: MspA family porin [Mycobacterium sp.]|nr:MspA family porin [Mycobacterium sp.]
MGKSMARGAAALAAVAALLVPAAPGVPASADPDPANPNGATPVAAAEAGPGPPPTGTPPIDGAPPTGTPPIDGAPPIDDGKVVSAPPTTMKASDGVTLTISAGDEIQLPVPPLTTAISTREYIVGGVFRGSISGSAAPKGVLEVGYQIGCGIDMGTGPGVLLGANLGANASLGLLAFNGDLIPIPNVGITGGGNVTVALKPGIVLTVPVTKKQFAGEAPRVSIRNFRVRIDGCVGESFIRSYAILARSTDERETILSWYGATKAV